MTDIKLRLKKQNDDLKEKPLSKPAKSNTCKNGEEISDTGPLCTQICVSPNKNRRLFLYVLCFRIINSFLVQTFYVPDEYWQCTEVAHKLVFGYGHMTWEWKNGLRSYSYPLIFAAYFYVLKLFKLDYSVLIHHQLRHEFESFNTRWGKLKVLSSLVIRSVFVSLALQMLFSAIDSYMHGSFTFVQYNFFKFNVLHNVADFYGVHSWHWYLTEGLPVVLCTHIIFVVIGIFIIICKQSKSTDEMIVGDSVFVSECGSDGMFLFIIVWTVFIYSLLGHKEFRFMSGLLPIFMHVSGVTAYKLFQQPIIHKAMKSLNSSSSSSPSSSVTHRVGKLTHHLKGTLCKNLSVSLIVVPNIILGMYLSIIHQRGPLDVALYLSKHLDDRDSVLFLMPCHSTPFYSYIHKNVTMQFLTCEPNLNHAIHYVDEADWFFNSPSKWIEQYDWSTLKQNSNRTYIVMFDRLYERVRTDLLSKGSMSGLKKLQIMFAVLALHLITIPSYSAQCVDSDKHECENRLRPHHCYIEHNRNLCCETCREHETSDPKCMYGDHDTVIVRSIDNEENKYNCESYISFFGRHHCRIEPKFQDFCCSSCRSSTSD
ncbi:hypothetical protein HELRODRAFT_189070 [Helobdella robusta]|uniref:Mannosyltransferase n=1 Tax=Helobdella robusta TaxID=6412 RepID=T1FQM0_HELRO|nr:hypothetical protein HELRODRAFT_189070 [Helobdella robusta]ESN96015.1 hypothetical protein HELRODRAFT_189070 [Helobdella robusta]